MDDTSSEPESLPDSLVFTAINLQRQTFIDSLPSLTKDNLVAFNHIDSDCPICYVPFLDLLASKNTFETDVMAIPVEDLGVTRLIDTCGHIFCRKDIITWIQRNNTCPICRALFIDAPKDEAKSHDQHTSDSEDDDEPEALDTRAYTQQLSAGGQSPVASIRRHSENSDIQLETTLEIRDEPENQEMLRNILEILDEYQQTQETLQALVEYPQTQGYRDTLQALYEYPQTQDYRDTMQAIQRIAYGLVDGQNEGESSVTEFE